MVHDEMASKLGCQFLPLPRVRVKGGQVRRSDRLPARRAHKLPLLRSVCKVHDRSEPSAHAERPSWQAEAPGEERRGDQEVTARRAWEVASVTSTVRPQFFDIPTKVLHS